MGGPPERANVLSCWSAKKPMDLPSGDQKGNLPPSVPGSGFAVALSKGRRNSSCFPSTIPAKTRLLPSREMAGAPAWSPSVTRVTLGGSTITERTTRAVLLWGKNKYVEPTAIARRRAAPPANRTVWAHHAFLIVSG